MISLAIDTIKWSFKNWKLVAIALAVLAVLAAGGCYGHLVRVDEQAKQDRASLNNLRNRSATDDEINLEDAVAICRRLGGGGQCSGLRHGG